MNLPERLLIETPRVIMRRLEKEDLPALFALNSDEEVVRYTPHEAWKTQEDAQAWFGRVLSNRESGAALQLAVILREDSRPVGTMVLFHFNEGAGSAEIGYSLLRELWGKGLAKEAVNAFVEYCFETLGLKRLEAQIDPRNPASAKVLTAAGFTKEGHQRRNFYAKGEVSDTGLYGLLRDDPRPVPGR